MRQVGWLSTGCRDSHLAGLFTAWEPEADDVRCCLWKVSSRYLG
jgi:hypothetical protein